MGRLALSTAGVLAVIVSSCAVILAADAANAIRFFQASSIMGSDTEQIQSLSPQEVYAAGQSDGNKPDARTVLVSPEVRSRRRKLILHVGPHKTGTTAFQSWLRINGGISPTLQYPKVCGKTQSPMWYHYLAASFCGLAAADDSVYPLCPPTAENFLANAGDNSSGSSDVIISSESFSRCSIDQFANIKTVFGRSFDVEVVILRRESKSLRLSRYHQWHKDNKQLVTTFSDVLKMGDKRQAFCSYTSLDCLQGLGQVFGFENVHAVSYEGLLATGKELADVVCDVFSASSGCYAPPSKDNQDYRVNPSLPHLALSAAVIFNRFKIITGCSHPDLSERDLTLFMGALNRSNVSQACYPISEIPSVDCDTCFRNSILNYDTAVSTRLNRYLFLEGAEYIDSSDDKVCEYVESAIFETPRAYGAVAAATRRISTSCDTQNLHLHLHPQL